MPTTTTQTNAAREAGRSEPITCTVRDSYGDVESCAIVETVSEAVAFFREHGLTLDDVSATCRSFTYTKKAA